MRTIDTSFIRRLSDSAALAAGALVLAAAAGPARATVILDPTLPGQYAAGTGANATFLAIDGTWTQSAVYWKQPPAPDTPGQFSNTKDSDDFKRVGEYLDENGKTWGTGIWGLSDWMTINNAGSVPIVHSWSGLVPTINQGDAEWAACAKIPETCGRWSVKADSLPTGFFGTEAAQDNWTSRYTGYIRITEPGEYNFGVLYDDGFFLNIWGADGSSVSISSDFLSPRNRRGFEQDLAMSPGLYRFELGAYDRLEVGVVNLAWKRPGGEWTTVPTENLIPVPTPGTTELLVAGLGALVAARMRRKRG